MQEIYQHICRPYNLYCVGGDVKPCSINQSIYQHIHKLNQMKLKPGQGVFYALGPRDEVGLF